MLRLARNQDKAVLKGSILKSFHGEKEKSNMTNVNILNSKC